ncbi:hypothetical protein BS47DRAFT_1322163 [Hydnum rufescens UP504]|uniref:Histone acetyltransferase type B catalytic subunit n=1 Tax=Hydnum rufescens UP504 TaxID=1448309 RepID=A0A9P6AJ46_9AGAM|nr:hypothetical protein BS47DRAFT_1322163 [Hydnum rufescens UP504]
MTEWTSNANEVLALRLAHADEDTSDTDRTARPFYPKFTYPIFGDEEKIYGYRDLAINLSFASGSLLMYLNIVSSARLPASTVDDVEGTLYKFIPSDYLKLEAAFKERVKEEAKSFRPCGEKVFSYPRPSGYRPTSGKGKVKAGDALDEDSEGVSLFEVYHATWETPGFRDLHRRMQLFILLYIEAGSYIQEDEEKWEFLVLYERRRRNNADKTVTYHFVGYTSLYPFFCWPDKVRLRLSQFVIVPPYQNQGHGASLYTAVYNHILSRPSVAELTMEDPSEAFEDLRDKTDLRMLFKHQEFLDEAYGTESELKGKLGPPSDKSWVEAWRRKLKIATRQFERLIEMLILRKLDPTDPLALRAYRLQVKERLYRFNFEILVTLNKKERIEKLEETFESVIEGYQGTLSLVE